MMSRTTASSTRGMLLALQHADSAFPSGAFAFSHGLEGLPTIEGAVGVDRLRAFLRGVLVTRWAPFDSIVVRKAHRAADNLDAVAAIDREVEAASTVEPLRTGSRRQGLAFLTAHQRIGTPGAADYREMIAAGKALGHVGVAQGLIWQRICIDEGTAVAMSGYGLAASIVTAAVRLGLIGVIDGQRLIAGLLGEIAAAIDGDASGELSSFAMFAEIAAVKQKTGSDMRLFSN